MENEFISGLFILSILRHNVLRKLNIINELDIWTRDRCTYLLCDTHGIA